MRKFKNGSVHLTAEEMDALDTFWDVVTDMPCDLSEAMPERSAKLVRRVMWTYRGYLDDEDDDDGLEEDGD